MNGFRIIQFNKLPESYHKDFKLKIIYDYLFYKSNYEKSIYNGTKINEGQLVTSVETIERDTQGLFSTKKIRVILKKLEDNGFIKLESSRRGTIVTILDYQDRHTFQGINRSTKPTKKEGKEVKDTRLKDFKERFQKEMKGSKYLTNDSIRNQFYKSCTMFQNYSKQYVFELPMFKERDLDSIAINWLLAGNKFK